MNPPTIYKVDEWRKWAHGIVFEEAKFRSLSSIKDDICRVGKIDRIDVQNYLFDCDKFSRVAAKRLEPLFQLWRIRHFFKMDELEQKIVDQDQMTDEQIMQIVLEDAKNEILHERKVRIEREARKKKYEQEIEKIRNWNPTDEEIVELIKKGTTV